MADGDLQWYPLWPILRADMLLRPAYPQAPSSPHYISLGQLRDFISGEGAGAVTAVFAGVGLSGGGDAGDVTLSVAPDLVLEGEPTTATPAGGDDSDRLATTAYVQGEIAGLVIGGGGIPEAPTDGQAYGRVSSAWTPVLPLTGGTISGSLAVTGPTVLGGSATAPTVALGDNSAAIATTAFVKAALGATGSVSITGGTGITVSPSPLTGTGSISLSVPVALAFGGTGATTAPLARAALSVPAIGVSDTAPATPANGDLWFDGVSAQLFCWVNDGSSSQWVQANTAPAPTAAKYTVGFSFVAGTLASSQLLGLHRFARAVIFPANFASYSGYASAAGATAAATASTVLSVDRALAASPNSFSQIGTITFAAGTINATFATSGAVSCAQGDVLRILGPATADLTLANVYITLVAQEA